MSNTYLAAIATTILHLHPPQPPPFFFTSRHNSTILCYYHTLWFYFSWRQQFLHVLIRPFHPQQQPQFDQSDRRPSAQPLNRWASSAGSEPKNSHFKAQWASSSSSSFSPFFQSPMSNVFNFYSSKSPHTIVWLDWLMHFEWHFYGAAWDLWVTAFWCGIQRGH